MLRHKAERVAFSSRRRTRFLRRETGGSLDWTQLQRPRDFEHEELAIPTSALVRPISGFPLSRATHDSIRKQMLQETVQALYEGDGRNRFERVPDRL